METDKLTSKIHWKYILIYGIAWGIFEATVGWYAHIMHIHMMTWILVLIGICCMYQAQAKSASISSPLLVALIAAMIKSFDLLLSGGFTQGIYMPMINIIIEGLIMFGFMMILYEFKETSFIRSLKLFRSDETNRDNISRRAK